MAAVAGEDVREGMWREEDAWCFEGSAVGRSHGHCLAVGSCLSQDGSKSLVWPLQLWRLDFAGFLLAPVRRITVYLRASAFW